MPDPLFPTYYDARRHFHDRFAADSRRLGLKTSAPAAVKSWLPRARRKLSDLLGLPLLHPVPPRPRMTESVDAGDHLRERWLLDVAPHLTMPFYLLRPKGPAAPRPAVICPHGHASGGKLAVAGVALTPALAATIAAHHYDYGVQFARAGLLAFCPDARGFGERQEREARGHTLDGSCHYLQMMGAPLGLPVAGMWTFDLLRLADHILARPDVRPGRLGCAGLSGGGLQTLYFTALDPRVTCAVVSGYFYGARASLLDMPANCPCNIVPRLWQYFDMGDLAALIAPRPLLIETGDQDPLNSPAGLKNVLSQVAITRQAYRALKAAAHLCHDVFPGEHRWHGVKAIPWMKKWLE